MRFFIDECITPRLVDHLCSIGHDAAHPRSWGGLRAHDHEGRDRCIREDRILVTENAGDFRGLFGKVDLHPGLIILPNANRKGTLELFALVVGHLEANATPDAMSYMVNRVIEVSRQGVVHDYPVPPARSGRN